MCDSRCKDVSPCSPLLHESISRKELQFAATFLSYEEISEISENGIGFELHMTVCGPMPNWIRRFRFRSLQDCQ